MRLELNPFVPPPPESPKYPTHNSTLPFHQDSSNKSSVMPTHLCPWDPKSITLLLDIWDGHSPVAAALHRPPLHCPTRCFPCVQNPFQTHSETLHCPISASCTRGTVTETSPCPSGSPASFPRTRPADGCCTQTPPPLPSTPPHPCCLPWVRRNASHAQDPVAEHKRNQSKICPEKVQQGRLSQAEVMLEWMRQNH